MQEAGVLEKLKKSYSFVSLVFGTHNIYISIITPRAMSLS